MDIVLWICILGIFQVCHIIEISFCIVGSSTEDIQQCLSKLYVCTALSLESNILCEERPAVV